MGILGEPDEPKKKKDRRSEVMRKRNLENNPQKDPAVRKKLADSRRGKKLSEEAKRKISESKKGKPRSEETRRKISETLGKKNQEKREKRKRGWL